MSDNPQYGLDALFPLPGIRVLRLDGRDAMAFAQSQFMNDVTLLADGHWQWSGWLDPKGRVQALFALLRVDAESLLVATGADVEALATALRRFVFRSRVTIAAAGVHASGRLAPPAVASGNHADLAADGSIELDLGGDAGARTLLLSDTPGSAPCDAGAWFRLDLAHGWPALPGTALDAWTPQQLSLERLAAFSVRKGCYPGQEIVARTHFLGRAKRGLARFRHAGATAGDAVVNAEGRDVGQVACVAGDELLAVVPLEADGQPLSAAGAALEALPLAAGLER